MSRYVDAITAAEIRNVKISETGIEYSTPSRPKNIGKISAKPTPKTISLTIDNIVHAAALPIACRKMKAALLTHAKIIIHRYILNAFTANSE